MTAAALAAAILAGLAAALFVQRQVADRPVNQRQFILLLYAGT